MRKTERLMLTFVCLFAAMIANARDFVFEGINYDITSQEERTCEVASNSTGYVGKVVIPEKVTYNGVEYTVTSIAYSAFYGSRFLTSVTIPATVKSIGENSFIDCTKVTELIYAEGCTTLLKTGLKSIVSVSFPSTITSIEDEAFMGCTKLTSFDIPQSVTKIGERAFSGCTGLTSIVIPENVTSIEAGTFSGCM